MYSYTKINIMNYTKNINAYLINKIFLISKFMVVLNENFLRILIIA